MIRIKSNDLNFGEKVILNPMDLNFNWGQIINFYGASGCGKTTLLNAIACRNDFLSEYHVNDKDILKMSEKDKKNYLFQHIGYVILQLEII